MRDIRILPASDVEQFTAGLFEMFTRSVEAQRAAEPRATCLECGYNYCTLYPHKCFVKPSLIATPEFDTCTVCGVSLPMGDEFDEHCCCGTGLGTNPDCARCNA